LFIYLCDYYHDDEVRCLVEKVEERFGTIDAFVYCAGSFHGYQLTHEFTAAQVEENIQSDLIGYLNFQRYVIPLMIEQNYGIAIALGSFAMDYCKPFLGLHAAVKKFLEYQIRTLANEQGYVGIRANMICPSIVDTPSERRLYPRVEPQHLVPPKIVARLVELLCYDPCGQYIHAQSIGLMSPWPRYYEQRVTDLRERGS
jgi:NAD(P)-dependent dehydrogenase (short-subunit alcohol dehydrogenase family)